MISRTRAALRGVRSTHADLHREAHHHVGGVELIAREPGRPGELGFPVVEMHLQLRADEGLVGLAADAAQQAFHEPRRPVRHEVEQELGQQRRHGRTFGVVQPVGLAPAVGSLKPSLSVGGQDVFDDGARLGQRQVAIGDDRRLAERMHRP
jgi:hypothetical protein